MRADEVVEALRRNFYSEREWAFLPQVSNGTGAGAGRTADAIALNCWPSRGMELHGFEVKISRSDWLSELKQPEKAEAVCRYCDRWFIVIDNAKIAQPAELPPTWGLIVIDDNPRVVVDAPKLQPVPLDRAFAAAVLRAAQKHGGIPQAEHVEALRKRFEDGVAYGVRSVERHDHVRSEIRWQHRALLTLEKSAVSTLQEIRRTLVDAKRLDVDEVVALASPQVTPAVEPVDGASNV